MRPLTVGSRGSALALWQAQWICDRLGQAHPGLQIRIEVIKTSGDRFSERSDAMPPATATWEGKAAFVKEIEEALLQGAIDLAVHSLKDLPADLPPGLRLSAFPCREDPRDALVCPETPRGWRDLAEGSRVATSSLRRQVQLANLRPDLQIVPIRGNVDTRLRKLRDQGLDGLVLAAAGLKRLGQGGRISSLFPIEEMVPAVGQGALAVETRESDPGLESLLEVLHDPATADCVGAERAFLRRLGGGCQVPMGAHAHLEGGKARFMAFLGALPGKSALRESAIGRREELEDLAHRVAARLLGQGARQILEEFAQSETVRKEDPRHSSRRAE